MMRWPLLTALALLTLGGCSFDDSTLPQKVGCERNDDCVSGVCSGGRCIVFDDDADAAFDASDTAVGSDTGATDGGGPCDGAALDPCGGCGDPAAEIGASCDDLCGTWACEGDALVCTGNAVNECGGCEPLDGEPGTECGGCGTWVCDGDAVVCEGIASNPCGGCNPIEGAPDDPCGACGTGRLECDGFEALVCVGDTIDFCGGCDAPPAAVADAPCECDDATWDDPAAWSCDGTSAVCADGSDADFGGPEFGPIADSSTETLVLTGAIETAGDYDWHRIRVRDAADFEGLYPQVRLQHADIADLVCLFWTYDEPRSWPVGCAGGSTVWEHEGQLGCCSAERTTNKIAAIVRDDLVLRLDSTPGDGNDNGTLHVLVINQDNRATCRPWRAEVTF